MKLRLKKVFKKLMQMELLKSFSGFDFLLVFQLLKKEKPNNIQSQEFAAPLSSVNVK